MLLKWDMQTMKYRLNAVCQELPQWNKRVYKINSHTSPLITTDRITKLSPSHGLNIEAETNGDFKKTNVPLPATAFRFAGSCRETVTSCSCFVCSCGNATRRILENWRCKKLKPFVGCQASKAKEKGNERLEGNAKAAATWPWKRRFEELKFAAKHPVTFNVHGH